MFINTAHAAPAGGGFDYLSFLPMVLIFTVFYFLIIRPQNAKIKKHRQMLSELRRGDEVVVNGSIFGTIAKVIDDNRMQVEIAENVKITINKSSITSVLDKNQHGVSTQS